MILASKTRDTWTLRRPALSCTKAWRQKRSRQRPELGSVGPSCSSSVPQDFPRFCLSAKKMPHVECVTDVVGDMLVLYFWRILWIIRWYLIVQHSPKHTRIVNSPFGWYCPISETILANFHEANMSPFLDHLEILPDNQNQSTPMTSGFEFDAQMRHSKNIQADILILMVLVKNGIPKQKATKNPTNPSERWQHVVSNYKEFTNTLRILFAKR